MLESHWVLRAGVCATVALPSVVPSCTDDDNSDNTVRHWEIFFGPLEQKSVAEDHSVSLDKILMLESGS